MTTEVTTNQNSETQAEGKGGVTRRRFLQILGSASAAGAVGCTDRAAQTILPNVHGDAESVPGVAVWYSSTCTECAAGCGIVVRTREGRAVKVEGNRDHPVNKGGVCALGQSSLQSHYDPDRIRQPLKRVSLSSLGKSTYEPMSWEEAYGLVASALKAQSKKKVLLTGEISGATLELSSAFVNGLNGEHVVYDAMQPSSLARANELVFGINGIPRYDFASAEVILNFGTDFLETWVNPCGYARGWADARRSAKEKVAGKQPKVFHVEPRLSLTAANADKWLGCKPGTENLIALAILKLVFDSRGRSGTIDDSVRSNVEKIVRQVSVSTCAAKSGVKESQLALAAQSLLEAKRSLVLAGGASSQVEQPLPLLVTVNFINLILGNIGQTIDLGSQRSVLSSPAKLSALVQAMDKGEVGALFLHGGNPAFNFPSSSGLKYAVKKVPLVVSFSSHLDESAELADVILPANSGFESWSDLRSESDVYSLVQPVMTPVFDTRNYADSLIEIANRAGVADIAQGNKTSQDYLQASWQKLHKSLGISSDFKSFWLDSVERGGYFPYVRKQSPAAKVNSESFVELARASGIGRVAAESTALTLLPYYSVKSFDGRAANRPWVQELPDPLTQVVWDSWAEINPVTAKEHGIAQGDMILVSNSNGQLNVPAYLTEFVVPGTIAVPLGQGHQSFGRYAKLVGGGNAYDLMKIAGEGKNTAVTYLMNDIEISRGRTKAQLVRTSGSNSQDGRELARSRFIDSAGASIAALGAAHQQDAHAEGHAEQAHGHDSHKPKQMYVQREHPLYEWGLSVDLNACTGCSACVVACYAENNIPVVGKQIADQGREMSWLRIETYWEGQAEELQVNFLPMMCQHCHNAPCEPVCPVFATYHNEEGLNAMVYNRCVGTRYCSNNCSYKVRRFNWYEYEVPEPLTWQLNPDVSKRTMGLMEKCTFCIQRINEAKDRAKDLGRVVKDGEVQPACVQSCPTQALVFGNLKDENSKIARLSHDERAYKVLDHHINTQPAVSYLDRVRYKF